MRSWFAHELVRLRVAEHQFVIRRLHSALAVLLAAAIGLVIGFAGGFAAGYHYPYRTLPRPPLAPGQVVPKSSSPQCAGTRHVMGGCLPHKPVPEIALSADITASTSGPDLSNNDPIYGSGWGGIAGHSAFAVFKVNQGTYYNDRTAAPMAAAAKARHLVVGGYDFLDVCRSAASDEARFFVSLLKADGLTGPNTLPPVADAEYPLGSLGCNGRSWVAQWITVVKSLTGRQPMVYTGAWWWDPHIGAWWPYPSLSWISGYTHSLSSVPRPGGNGHIDLWQFSDHGYNGYNYSDLSAWENGAAAFTIATASKPPGPSPALTRSRVAARGRSLHSYYAHGCRQPVLTTGTCGQLAWRVDHFQKLIDTARGYSPRCFGRHANLQAAECQIVRPAVAVWSRARASTDRAALNNRCDGIATFGLPNHSPTCRTLAQRRSYFDRRASHSVATSRL